MTPEWLDNYMSLHPLDWSCKEVDETRSTGLMYSNSQEFQMVEGPVVGVKAMKLLLSGMPHFLILLFRLSYGIAM